MSIQCPQNDGKEGPSASGGDLPVYVYILVSVVSTAACLLVAAAVVVCLSTARRRGRAQHLRATDRCKKRDLKMAF